MTDRYSNPMLAREAEANTLAGFVLRWISALIMAYAFLISPVLMHWGASARAADINVFASQSNPFNQLFWGAVLGASILSAWHNFRNIGRLLGDPVALLMLLYLLFAAASVLWSPVPAIAFRRLALQVIIVLALGISILSALRGGQRALVASPRDRLPAACLAGHHRARPRHFDRSGR
ncbi:hypothetical protein [Breoghania sp.]|uniref:hypothetical protein n=1 Tax=Breoghania sp. TaxID=2065378 RepID=UPI00261EDFD1|nr:hypothetical protein [Breoghania sp.]MDJ0930992.1 hypothetical protein [Breoghania sp.]